MRKFIILVCIITLNISCNNSPKKTTPIQKKKLESRNINDFLIFENLLVIKDIENAEYSNIHFQKEGAVFSRNSKKPTYIKIPFSNLDFSNEFNVSFTFRTSFDDGRKPQSFLAFVNKNSTTFKIPLYLYLPKNKISGVYGEQHLYFENYNKKNNESNAFLSSDKISIGKLYFVSVNYTSDNVIEIFLNSDLYATFDGLSQHNLKSTHLIIGSMLQREKAILPFEGTIYGLKIFNKTLKESEIVTLFNSQPLFLTY
jgi:hypothetical protein